MGEELDKIEKELDELEKKKKNLYRQKLMLFMKLKSKIDLLGQYIEFVEKQDIDFSPLGKSKPVPVQAHVEKQDEGIIPELIQTSIEINKILGLLKLPSDYEKMSSLPEIDEEIKRVKKEIERETREKAIIEREGK